MIKSLHNEKAFTLIEMLIVLFIIISVTGITLVSFKSLHEKQETDHFLEQVKKDLYLAQEYAISHPGKTIQVLFKPEEHLYTVEPTNLSNTKMIVQRSYNSKITVEKRTMGLTVKYLGTNGNISTAGTIGIRTPQGVYDLKFHPGKGRFYIAKQ